jgi:Fe-S-cluster-containing hydrogenase component 2
LSRRRIAVIECPEEIPCNPCETACPEGAIYIGEPITNRPQFNAERCIGCGLCIAACPGLAIFLVTTDSDDEAEVTFPYEFLPLPEPGQIVTAVNREGESLAQAVVKKRWQSQGADGTHLVTIMLPAQLANQARGIRGLNNDRR